MFRRKKLYRIYCLISLFFCGFLSFGQVTISGPTCVIPGTVYLYDIGANWDSASSMQLCINGGIIADSAGNTSCSGNGAPVSSVKVIWNDLANASINITSSKGNASFNINITDTLKAGSIDTS